MKAIKFDFFSMKGFFFLSISLFVFYSCSKKTLDDEHALSSQMSIKTENISTQFQDSIVLTPFGYKYASQVHYIPNNHKLFEKNGIVYETESKTNQIIRSFEKFENHNENLSNMVLKYSEATSNISKSTPAVVYGKGWITYAMWQNTNPAPISYFSTNWIVPPMPITNNGQLIYIFNALQDGLSSSSFILQPVLQWGTSPAGGGAYWSITNWYGGGTAKQYYYGNLYRVDPGTNLQGVMELNSDQSNGGYNYKSYFVGYPTNTSYTHSTPLLMDYAFQTLEAYGIKAPTDYPTVITYPNTNVANPLVEMKNIQINLNDGTNNVPINWTPLNPITDIGQHTQVLSTSQVNLFFTDPFVIIGPLINGKSQYLIPSGANGYYSGIIQAQPGSNVTIQIAPQLPPPFNFSFNGPVSININSSSVGVTKSFIMNSSGSTQWNATLSGSSPRAVGISIRVS